MMEYSFCPKCGAALARCSIKAGEPDRLVCQGCGFIFYLDPKVAVGTIISTGEGIVLVKRAIEPAYGKWVFPGGLVDRGERVIIVYTAEVIGGRLAAGDETLEARCYSSAAIPWPELAFPSTAEALRDFLTIPVKG